MNVVLLYKKHGANAGHHVIKDRLMKLQEQNCLDPQQKDLIMCMQKQWVNS